MLPGVELDLAGAEGLLEVVDAADATARVEVQALALVSMIDGLGIRTALVPSTKNRRLARAAIDAWIPGKMAPPRYSPSFETQSKVVAVPKSTAITGPPSSSNAATELTILSAPTSCGLS